MTHSYFVRPGCLPLVLLLVLPLFISADCVAQELQPQHTLADGQNHAGEREVIETLQRMKIHCNVSADGHLQNFSTNHQHPVPPQMLRYIDGLPQLWSFTISNATDEILRPLAKIELPALTMISLTGGNVTDASFRHLVRFPTLNALNLGRTHITNEGLAYLGRLPEMYLLRLNGTIITDAGLKHLVGLKKLGHLELEYTAITDEGLRWIGQLENVHTLYLRGTRISDTGLSHLRNIKSLRALALDRTAITDRGLGAFNEFPALQGIEHLYLADTNVSDAGMIHLDCLRGLKGISLDGTRVTSAMVAKIKARPLVYWITGGR